MNFAKDIRVSYCFVRKSAMFEQEVQTRRHATRMLRWRRLRHGLDKKSKQLENLISGTHEKKVYDASLSWICEKMR